MKSRLVIIAGLLTTLLLTVQPALATPTTSTCATSINGTDIAIGKPPATIMFHTFIGQPNTGIIKHFLGANPGGGACPSPGTIGAPQTDISLGSGIGASWGVALDLSGNLFVAAGPSSFGLNQILEIAAPSYTTVTPFFCCGTNFRSLAVKDGTLYAADNGAGTVLSFALPSSTATAFATIPGAFGVFANGVSDLFVTSNSGFSVVHANPSPTTFATGLSFPEGISGNSTTLFIASGGIVFSVPISGGTPAPFAGSPISASHGVTFWKGGVYVTDSIAFSVFKVA